MKTYVLNKPEIAKWKAEHGKTSQELAGALGVHPVTLSAWLNGHSPLPLAAALQLEDITGLALKPGALVREVA